MHIEHTKNSCTIFFHPDYTVGFGITPNHAFRLVGFTTGRESHPALKIQFINLFQYSKFILQCQDEIKTIEDVAKNENIVYNSKELPF